MRSLLVLTILACVLALPPAAGGTLVVQKGIAGVELRMTAAQVRATLGTPRAVRHGRNEFGRYTNFVYRRVTIMFQSGSRVTGLRTRSPRERTRTGVGVGSSEAQLRARVRRVRCMTTLSSRQCVVGALKPGRIVTAFFIERGRISSVTLGFVLD